MKHTNGLRYRFSDTSFVESSIESDEETLTRRPDVTSDEGDNEMDSISEDVLTMDYFDNLQDAENLAETSNQFTDDMLMIVSAALIILVIEKNISVVAFNSILSTLKVRISHLFFVIVIKGYILLCKSGSNCHIRI